MIEPQYNPERPPRSLPSINEIYEWWDGSNKFVNVMTDLCWRCGNFARVLERCHIVARCDGGLDDVQNLNLLCRTCHDLTEYSVDPEAYWKCFNLTGEQV